MISPILVERGKDGRWVARCRAPRCDGGHTIAIEETAGAAQDAAMPHLRELGGAVRGAR